jgi:nitrile hydratase subunit alpha
MSTTRRGFLTTAATAVGGAATHDLTHVNHQQQDHDHQAVPSDIALLVKALESLLVEKGLVDPAGLDALIDTYEHKVGPRNGARVVARAWADPAYKQRLLTSADAAIAEMGYGGLQGEHMVVVENTPKVHNLIVCTLCSCYPWPVLGLPPVWYKSAPYRSRTVIDPRGVLREFGVELGEDVEVRVWDSTAELRYLVLPERPVGSEKMNEEELATLVTRDAMVGVAKVVARQEGAHERCPRHGWDARHGSDSAGERRARLSRSLGSASLRNDSRDGCVAQVEPRRVPLPARVDPSGRVLAHELLRKMDCGTHGADGQDWLSD